MNDVDDDNALGGKIATGAAWLMALKVGTNIVEVASLIILARLLSPDDFGLVALGTSIAAGVGLIQRTSFGMALIQNQQATRAHYESAWTIQLFLSSAAALLLLLASGSTERLFDSPALGTVVTFAALSMFIDGWGNIAVVDFQKQMRFEKTVLLESTKLIFTKMVILGAAFYLRDYRALLIGLVLSSVFGLIIGYAMIPFRPRFTIKEAKSLFGFSVWVQGATVLAYLNRHIQNFVVGGIEGVKSVGILKVSGDISSLTTSAVQGPIGQASYPAFAQRADDLPALVHQYSSVLSYTTLLALPTSIGIGVTASHFVPLLLGPQWTNAIPVIQVLVFVAAMQSMTSASNPVFMAVGKPKLITILAATRMLVLVPTLIFATTKFGIIGVAWALALTTALLFPVRQLVLQHVLQARFAALFQGVLRPILATAAMALCVIGVDARLALGVSPIMQFLELGLLTLTGVVAFAAALAGQWVMSGRPNGPETQIARVARQRLNRLMARGTAGDTP